jgi:hypothetical protein
MHPSIVLSDATRNADKLWAAVVEKSLGHRRGFIEAQLPEFIEWKKGLERIGSFWTGEDQIAVIGAHRGKEPVGLIRMLRVPILPWEIHVWGREEKFRAELQDIAIGSSSGPCKRQGPAASRFSEARPGSRNSRRTMSRRGSGVTPAPRWFAGRSTNRSLRKNNSQVE